MTCTIELTQEEVDILGNAFFKWFPQCKMIIDSPEHLLWRKLVDAGYRGKVTDLEIPF